MRLLTWNLNHRAASRRIPDWVSVAIEQQAPDAVVLTEYVQGPSHAAFCERLARIGLPHLQVSQRTEGHNQVLIASATPLQAGSIQGPALHPAVPSNVLHVHLPQHQLQLLGIRMPAFKPEDRAIKRAVWEWLNRISRTLEPGPAVVSGDLNTALGDKPSHAGDCLQVLPRAGWQHAIPETGHSWRSARYGTLRRIDHSFLAPGMPPARSRYLWDFQALAPEAPSGRVGIPDHAMLVVDFSPR